MRLALSLTAMLAAACGGDKDDTGTTGTGGDDTSTSSATFTISGTAVDLMSGSPAAEGLCVHVADPTAALTGGDLDILASSTVGADGSYSVTDIPADDLPTVGLLMLVQDCNDEGTVMPTATGISSGTYADVTDGSELSDITVYSIDATTAGGLQAGLAAAGYSGDFQADGALLGFVLDSSGQPVDGAVVSGPASATTYYFAGKGFDTTATHAAANAMFVIPAAPIYAYSCEADGYTFEDVTAGSQPGYAVLIKFVAN